MISSGYWWFHVPKNFGPIFELILMVFYLPTPIAGPLLDCVFEFETDPKFLTQNWGSFGIQLHSYIFRWRTIQQFSFWHCFEAKFISFIFVRSTHALLVLGVNLISKRISFNLRRFWSLTNYEDLEENWPEVRWNWMWYQAGKVLDHYFDMTK